MTQRSTAAATFLATTQWRGAAQTMLAGDASNRKYFRLRHPISGESAVLMDAAPDLGEDVRPFVKIAQHLLAMGLSAPRILAQDLEQGFLLLEDLGDALFARVVADTPTMEEPLYQAATDVLTALHRNSLPELAPYSPAYMTQMAGLAWGWYAQHTLGPDPQAQAAFEAAFLPILDSLENTAEVLIQRDYHAENLLWLPQRHGVARVGLLDFQDAMAGHRAYDLVSLLQDARRDVSPQIEAQMITRYIETNQLDRDSFCTAYAVLGAQRNLRIMGVFARLCLRDAKPHYIALMPRVWGLLQRDLRHPALAPVRAMIDATLPIPTADILETLKSQCPTH